jgi:hypothetical protein
MTPNCHQCLQDSAPQTEAQRQYVLLILGSPACLSGPPAYLHVQRWPQQLDVWLQQPLLQMEGLLHPASQTSVG